MHLLASCSFLLPKPARYNRKLSRYNGNHVLNFKNPSRCIRKVSRYIRKPSLNFKNPSRYIKNASRYIKKPSLNFKNRSRCNGNHSRSNEQLLDVYPNKTPYIIVLFLILNLKTRMGDKAELSFILLHRLFNIKRNH